MRKALPVALTLFITSAASAQHINNVTWTPPVRACSQVTFQVLGTAPPGMQFTFLNTSVTSNTISFVIEASGPASGSSSFNKPVGPVGPFAEGTYALSVGLQYNGTITSTWTGTLIVLPAIPHNLGEPNEVTVCPNAASFSLFSRLLGTPEPGGNWIDPQMQPVTNGMFVPGTSQAGLYLYYFPTLAPCEQEYQYLTVLYAPNNSAGSNTTVTLCTAAGSPSVALFPLLGGTPDAGGTWTGPGANTSGTFIPGTSLPGQYVYHVTGIAPCPDPTATLTVIGGPPSNPGIPDSAFYCYNETAAVLNNHLTGEGQNGFWFSPSGLGITWYGQPVDVSVYGAGNYAYVVTVAPCPADTAYVPVTLIGPPCTLGIPEEKVAAWEVRLLPNPASGQVSVEIAREQPAKQLELEILGLDGKVTLHKTIEGKAGTQRLTMDISRLTPGAYLLKLSTPEGAITKPLMVE